MSGYQFIHVEMYARSVSKLAGKGRAKKGQQRKPKTADTGWTARQIVAEARREVGQFSKSINPLKPEPIFGDIDSLATELDALDADPPKGQRKDTPILLAGVVSSEWEPDDPRSIEWRMDVLAYLSKVFGPNLRAVVAHNDENHDHMHFYVCMPSLAPVKGLHPGHIARQKAKDAGEDAKAQTEAYTAAMKALQDDYYQQVAKNHGQARIGPKRERLGRMEWQERQAQAELIAEVQRASDMDRAEAATAVESARLDAKRVIQSAKAQTSIIQDAIEVRLKEVEKQKKEVAQLKEEAKRLRDGLVLEREAFNKEVGLFRKMVKQIFDRLPNIERRELEPFLSAYDRAKEAVLAVRDRFTNKSKSGLDALP